MPENIDIDTLRTWIGRENKEGDCVTPELLKRFRATLDAPAPADDSAFTHISHGIHWCLALPAAPRAALGVDGHPAKGGFLPPVPLPARMWVASRVRFHKPLVVNAHITRTSAVADVVLKQSAASGPLVFVHIDHVYSQQVGDNSETLIEDRQTIVYRRPVAYQAPQAQAAHTSARVLTVVPDSTLLFRYSALTFNGHRIHYDHPYATREEGYPSLVVQAPLMATLLMNLAQACRPDQALAEFEFRGTAPAFVDQALRLAMLENTGTEDELRETLEIRNPTGALIMTASARFADSASNSRL